MQNNFRTILNILFTPQCVLCQNSIEIPALCISCTSLALPYPLHEFNSLPSARGALFYYEFSLRALIKGVKFYRQSSFLFALRNLIAERLDSPQVLSTLNEFSPSAICAIPTPPFKRLLRGTDAPLMFAHMLSKRLGVPVINLLGARHKKPSLARISNKSARKEAVKGAFFLKPAKETYDRLLLVDDIFTTGSTFDESSKLLKSVAGDIRCLAISRTP